MTPRTIIVRGTGTQTATYTLPPGLLQYVQSVRVTVDAGAAPDVNPTLDIAEQSGVVIATKRQTQPISSGTNPGSATWALRLDDEPSPPLLDPPYGYFTADAINAAGTVILSSAAYSHLGYRPSGGGGERTMTLGVLAAINDYFQAGFNNTSPDVWIGNVQRANVLNTTTGQYEMLSGNQVIIPGFGSDLLTWDTHDSGAVLLNRANPQRPKFAVAGAYVLTINIVG